MKCTNCGSLIDEDARFCPKCGSQLFNPSKKPVNISQPSHLDNSVPSNLDDDIGTRGNSKQKIRTKYFYSKARHAHEVGKIVNRFLISQNLETQIIDVNSEIIVQGKKKPNIFNKALGLDQSVTVGISIEGNDIKVTIGGAKWIDKAVGAAIGLVVFAPVLLTAGWGTYKQKQLFSRIEEEIEKFLSSKE